MKKLNQLQSNRIKTSINEWVWVEVDIVDLTKSVNCIWHHFVYPWLKKRTADKIKEVCLWLWRFLLSAVIFCSCMTAASRWNNNLYLLVHTLSVRCYSVNKFCVYEWVLCQRVFLIMQSQSLTLGNCLSDPTPSILNQN